MAEFICVHENGEKRLVNLAWVEEIRPAYGDKACIHLGFQLNDAFLQDCINTDESFSRICELLDNITFGDAI